MRLTRSHYFVYYSILVWACLSLTHSQLDPDDVEKIDNFMAEVMECREMSGAAIALLKNNEIVLTKGYGFANLEAQTPVTQDTVFAIASVSKSFTATLMAKLFANGDSGLSWNSVVSEAYDEIYFHNGYVTNHTMFRDLLSHQTGIPRHDATWVFGQFDNRADIVKRIRFMQPEYEFRSDFMYSNIMFNMAMYPLEQLMSSTWEDLLTTELLQPIGMNSTTFYDLAEATEYAGFATPYAWDRDNPNTLIALPFETWSGAGQAGPAASVSSTASDMARWLRFILQEGRLEDGTQIMEPSDLERLWNPEAAYEMDIFTKPNWPISDSWGSYSLSYFNGYYRGYKSHSHGGDLTGFHSEAFILPDMDIATFFTTNFGGITLERQLVRQYLADILLGVEPFLNASLVCELLEELDTHESQVTQYDNHMVISNDVLDLLKSLQFGDGLIKYYTDEAVTGIKGLPKLLVYELHDVIQSVKKDDYSTARQVESYTGEYGNFVHGNLTVSLSEECEDCLLMEYGKLGQFTLYPTNSTDVFFGINSYYLISVTPVVFSGSDGNGNSEYVSPILFEVLNPPVFQRGLLMSDAPPPTIDVCHF